MVEFYSSLHPVVQGILKGLAVIMVIFPIGGACSMAERKVADGVSWPCADAWGACPRSSTVPLMTTEASTRVSRPLLNVFTRGSKSDAGLVLWSRRATIPLGDPLSCAFRASAFGITNQL